MPGPLWTTGTGKMNTDTLIVNYFVNHLLELIPLIIETIDKRVATGSIKLYYILAKSY